MKYAPLVLKHLRKNWLRTASTVLAMAVCIFLFCVLQTVIAAVNFGLHAGNTNRLVVRDDAVSSPTLLPMSYKQKIAAIPGVKDVVIVNWFGGIYRDPKNFFANLAVEPDAFLRMYPEIMLPPEQKEKWLGDCAAHHRPQAGPALRLEARRHRSTRKLHPPLPRRQAIRVRDRRNLRHRRGALSGNRPRFDVLQLQVPVRSHRTARRDWHADFARSTIPARLARSARPSTTSSRTATTRPRPKPSRRSAPDSSRWPATWRCC